MRKKSRFREEKQKVCAPSVVLGVVFDAEADRRAELDELSWLSFAHKFSRQVADA